MGSLGATLTQVFTRVWRGCVIHRCQNKNPREELRPEDVSDVMHSKRGLRIWGFEKKRRVEFLPTNERVEIQTWARPDDFVRYGSCALVGLRTDDVKAVSIERLCLSLSSCRKTFKLKKVNKSFVPELISWMSCILDSLCLFHTSLYYGYVTRSQIELLVFYSTTPNHFLVCKQMIHII